MESSKKMQSIISAVKGFDMAKADLWDKSMLLQSLAMLCVCEKNYLGEEGDAVKELLPIVIKETSEYTPEDNNELANFIMGNVCYTLATLTGEDSYKEKAVKIGAYTKTQKRSEEGYFVEADGNKCLCNTYASYPFYMTYETKNGGKEQYNDIIAQVKSIYGDLFENAKKEAIEGEKHVYCSLSYFAAAMIDTMEVMDQALYEIFAKLREYLKDAVAVCVESEKLGNSMNDCSCKMMAAYAIYKACRMKALHTEKYEKYADELFAKADLDGKDMEYVAAYIMAYTESLKNREYQDYGRTRGGVLWN